MESTRPISNEPPEKVTDVHIADVAIILVSPRVPENIGAAARAMKNFGLRDLRIVAPRDYDEVRAQRMARGGNEVLDNARWHETIAEAVGDIVFLCATSARLGGQRTAVATSPEKALEQVLANRAGGPVGILFGPEERGLTNRELDLASTIVTIPTNPAFSSLNLAQAVVVICYELSRLVADTALHRATAVERADAASLAEIDGLFEHGRSFLLEAGFLNPQNPDAVLLHLRKLLARANPTSHEVRTLRGILRQVAWYARNAQS